MKIKLTKAERKAGVDLRDVIKGTKPKTKRAMPERLPKNVDYHTWLEDHAEELLPKSGVFYVVAYDRKYTPSDLDEVFEASPIFLREADARVAAYELSRGNMNRAVVRCEVVALEPAH